MPVLRSLLFAPGDHPRRREKAFEVGADGVILDLEDAVAVSAKDSARKQVAALLKAKQGHAYTIVRVNALSTEHAMADVEAVVGAGLNALMLPKVETVTDVRIIDWLLSQQERRMGLAPGTIELQAIIETAQGLTAIDEIARSSPRLRRIFFGVADFTLDIGMEWSAASPFLVWAGAMVVTVSKAAGLEPPLDTLYQDVADHAGFRKAAEAGRALGFQGKTCIHPDQVAIANQVFTPTEAAIAEAWKVYSAFCTAESTGQASIQLDGRFVDYPIAHRARRVLEAARAAGVLPDNIRLPG